MRIKTIQTSNKNFILKYFRCRDGKRTNKNWDGGYLYYPFLHSTTMSHYVLHVHSVQWNAGMGNTDTPHSAHDYTIEMLLHVRKQTPSLVLLFPHSFLVSLSPPPFPPPPPHPPTCTYRQSCCRLMRERGGGLWLRWRN